MEIEKTLVLRWCKGWAHSVDSKGQCMLKPSGVLGGRKRCGASSAKRGGYNIACSMPISDAGTRGDLTTLGLVIRNG